MYAEKLLPHDVEAEEAIIGSLLLDGDSFLRVSSVIKTEDFYREKNAICYKSCEELFRRSEAIDQVTLARELARADGLETVGGMAYLSHLVSITPTSANAEHYAHLIARTSTMRRLIEAASRISAIGYDDTDDVEATLRRAEDMLFQVRSGQSERGFVPLRQVYDQFLEDRAAIADPLESSAPVMTNFSDLDELLGGLQSSDLLILGARPGVGKSTLALNISLSAARNGATVGFFSLEMSREQLALRILASDAGVDSHRLRLGLYTEAEEQRIIDSIGQLSELPVYIDDTPYREWWRCGVSPAACCWSMAEPADSGLSPIGPGLLRSRGGDNRVQEIGEISRSLKGMARDLNVPIITCSQLSRGVENRTDHRPLLSDLRDSGSIEQDADIVMFIYREDDYSTEEEWEQQHPGRDYPRNIAEIIVAKHRHGPTGSVKLRFQNNLLRFVPLGRAEEF